MEKQKGKSEINAANSTHSQKSAYRRKGFKKEEGEERMEKKDGLEVIFTFVKGIRRVYEERGDKPKAWEEAKERINQLVQEEDKIEKSLGIALMRATDEGKEFSTEEKGLGMAMAYLIRKVWEKPWRAFKKEIEDLKNWSSRLEMIEAIDSVFLGFPGESPLNLKGLEFAELVEGMLRRYMRWKRELEEGEREYKIGEEEHLVAKHIGKTATHMLIKAYLLRGKWGEETFRNTLKFVERLTDEGDSWFRSSMAKEIILFMKGKLPQLSAHLSRIIDILLEDKDVEVNLKGIVLSHMVKEVSPKAWERGKEILKEILTIPYAESYISKELGIGDVLREVPYIALYLSHTYEFTYSPFDRIPSKAEVVWRKLGMKEEEYYMKMSDEERKEFYNLLEEISTKRGEEGKLSVLEIIDKYEIEELEDIVERLVEEKDEVGAAAVRVAYKFMGKAWEKVRKIVARKIAEESAGSNLGLPEYLNNLAHYKVKEIRYALLGVDVLEIFKNFYTIGWGKEVGEVLWEERRWISPKERYKKLSKEEKEWLEELLSYVAVSHYTISREYLLNLIEKIGSRKFGYIILLLKRLKGYEEQANRVWKKIGLKDETEYLNGLRKKKGMVKLEKLIAQGAMNDSEEVREAALKVIEETGIATYMLPILKRDVNKEISQKAERLMEKFKLDEDSFYSKLNEEEKEILLEALKGGAESVRGVGEMVASAIVELGIEEARYLLYITGIPEEIEKKMSEEERLKWMRKLGEEERARLEEVIEEMSLSPRTGIKDRALMVVKNLRIPSYGVIERLLKDETLSTKALAITAAYLFKEEYPHLWEKAEWEALGVFLQRWRYRWDIERLAKMVEEVPEIAYLSLFLKKYGEFVEIRKVWKNLGLKDEEVIRHALKEKREYFLELMKRGVELSNKRREGVYYLFLERDIIKCIGDYKIAEAWKIVEDVLSKRSKKDSEMYYAVEAAWKLNKKALWEKAKEKAKEFEGNNLSKLLTMITKYKVKDLKEVVSRALQSKDRETYLKALLATYAISEDEERSEVVKKVKELMHGLLLSEKAEDRIELIKSMEKVGEVIEEVGEVLFPLALLAEDPDKKVREAAEEAWQKIGVEKMEEVKEKMKGALRRGEMDLAREYISKFGNMKLFLECWLSWLSAEGAIERAVA